jgi:hypothetical protein
MKLCLHLNIKMRSLLVIIGFILFWSIFAVFKEKKEQKYAYMAAAMREQDSISASLRKIRYCMTYDLRTIKWRRSIVGAVIATTMLFILAWRRLPSSAELITHVLVITTVFSLVWSNFSTLTSSEAVKYTDSNIDHIKKLLIKEHSFILPIW